MPLLKQSQRPFLLEGVSTPLPTGGVPPLLESKPKLLCQRGCRCSFQCLTHALQRPASKLHASTSMQLIPPTTDSAATRAACHQLHLSPHPQVNCLMKVKHQVLLLVPPLNADRCTHICCWGKPPLAQPAVVPAALAPPALALTTLAPLLPRCWWRQSWRCRTVGVKADDARA